MFCIGVDLSGFSEVVNVVEQQSVSFVSGIELR